MTPADEAARMTIEQAFEALAEELDGHVDYKYLAPLVRRALAKVKAEGEPAVKCHQLHAMAGSNKCLATTAEECRCQRENHPPGTNHQWPCRTTAPAAHLASGEARCARNDCGHDQSAHGRAGVCHYNYNSPIECQCPNFVPPPEPKPVVEAPTTTSAAGPTIVAAFLGPDNQRWQGTPVMVRSDGAWLYWDGKSWAVDIAPASLADGGGE